jgi:hypothetical protein
MIVAINITSIIGRTFRAQSSPIVEAMASTHSGSSFCAIATDYQKWNIIAIYEASAIGAWFQWIVGPGHRFCD